PAPLLPPSSHPHLPPPSPPCVPLPLSPPPAPPPPPFPYTTLFRSGARRAARPVGPPGRPGSPHRRVRRHSGPASLPRPAARERRDRKSTRLNSSHVSTSYAVFCRRAPSPRRGTLCRVNTGTPNQRT